MSIVVSSSTCTIDCHKCTGVWMASTKDGSISTAAGACWGCETWCTTSKDDKRRERKDAERTAKSQGSLCCAASCMFVALSCYGCDQGTIVTRLCPVCQRRVIVVVVVVVVHSLIAQQTRCCLYSAKKIEKLVQRISVFLPHSASVTFYVVTFCNRWHWHIDT